MLETELKAVGGKHDGQIIPIPLEKFLIGRGEDCHLRPNDESVSRHHCVISTDEFCVRVRDLGSTNGTYVNEERIHGQAILSSGDKIEIGDLTFEVSIHQTGEGEPASVGTEDNSDDTSDGAESANMSPDFQVSDEAAAAKTIVEMPVPGFLSAPNLGETMPVGETSIMDSQSASDQPVPAQPETQFPPADPSAPSSPPQPPPAGAPLAVDPQLLQQQLQQLVQQQLQQQLEQTQQQAGSTDQTQKPEVADLPPIRLPDPETTGAKDEPPADSSDEPSAEDGSSEKPEDDSTSVASEIIKKYRRRRGT